MGNDQVIETAEAVESLPEPPCPVCGNRANCLVVKADFNLTGATRLAYQVVECLDCRFRYTTPRPEPAELASYYAADYPAHALGPGGHDASSPEQRSRDRRLHQVAHYRLRLIDRHLRKRLDGLRLLDIGCGGGSFLRECSKQAPVEAWGIDIAGTALEAPGSGGTLPAAHSRRVCGCRYTKKIF